jgi:hypothetical protein
MPIGSFEAGWENYDHTSGPALVDEVKNLLEPGAEQPNWRLVLGTEDFTQRLKSVEVTFSKEGEGGARFVVAASLRALQYERAPVSIYFGYGTKLVPYFRGRLASPVDSVSGLNSEATAYGLKVELGQRYFAQRLNYGEWDLRDAVADIIDRFGADTDRFEFRGTHSTELANDIGEFGLEVSLSEALETVLEPMQFVMWDQPGGMVIIERGHLASLGTDNVFSGAGHYDIQHYPKGGFSFDESMANFYDDVVIFRRTEEYAGGGGEPGLVGPGGSNIDDEYAVYVDKDVAGDNGITNSGQFNVQQGRNWVVPDYPGQQEHAERERELLVTALSRGVGRFEFNCFPTDFSIGDHFSVTRHEQIVDPTDIFDPSTYSIPQMDAVTYACIAEEITFTLVAREDESAAPSAERWTMTVTGQAFELQRTTIRGASSTSIGLAVAPGFGG